MSATELFGRGFDELEQGLEFRTYGRTITEADLVSFAGLTGDHHPLHTDAAWAERSRFGGRIAHGMLLLSYSVGLAPIDPERVVALRGFDRVTFKRPVKLGDTVHLEGRIEQLKPLDEETGSVRALWKLLNQRDRVVLRAVAEILWRRRPAPSPNGAATLATNAGEIVTAPEPVYL